MSAQPPDPQAQIAALRPALLRFARLQLRNDSVAEDVVSETLLALLERPDAFAGRSSLRTFATGVLKHKIIDHLRRAGREAPLALDASRADADLLDSLFHADGHWIDPPPAWGDPDASFAQREFFDVLQACVDHLPETAARLFMLREWLEFDTDECARELGVTANNVFVMLHRARLRLRECLQLRWFGDEVRA